MNSQEVQLSEDLIESAMEASLFTTLPKGRFFEPNQKFWGTMVHIKARLDITMFLDCGCGDGDLGTEAPEYNLKIAGCDVFRRDGARGLAGIQHIPAHRFLALLMSVGGLKYIPMVCRPDHSGWVAPLWYRSEEYKCGFIYVGHGEKLQFDVNPDRPHDIQYDDVGNDGENMYIWMPR